MNSTRHNSIAKTLLGLVGTAVALFVLSPAAQAQFTCTTNAGAITITGYTGPGGNVVIPGSITGLPVTTIGDSAFNGLTNLTGVIVTNTVTSIGNFAFSSCNHLTNVIISPGVTTIGNYAFNGCPNLSAITLPASVTNLGIYLFVQSGTLVTVDPANPAYSSTPNGVLFDKNKTTLIAFPGSVGGSYTILNTVTNVAIGAFDFAYQLSSITVPASVVSVGDYGFGYCFGLTAIYFQGNTPSAGSQIFSGTSTTVYYYSGTSGWAATFAGLTTALVNPFIVQFNFAGKLNGKTDPNNVLPAGITATSAFTATLSYNTGFAPDNAPDDPSYGYFIYNTGSGGMSMTVNIGTNTFTSLNPLSSPYDVFITHLPPGSLYSELAWETTRIYLNGSPIPGSTSANIDVDFQDSTGVALANDAKPTTPPVLTKFDGHGLNIYAGTNVTQLFGLSGDITNVTAILPPILTISRPTSTNAAVSWTVLATNYVPEQSAALTGAWTQVNPPYQTNAGQISLAVPATNGNKFFRLHAP